MNKDKGERKICARCEKRKVSRGASPVSVRAQELDLCITCYQTKGVAASRRGALGFETQRRRGKIPKPTKAPPPMKGRSMNQLLGSLDELSEELETLAGQLKGLGSVVGSATDKTELTLEELRRGVAGFKGKVKERSDRLVKAEDAVRDAAKGFLESIPEERKILTKGMGS